MPFYVNWIFLKRNKIKNSHSLFFFVKFKIRQAIFQVKSRVLIAAISVVVSTLAFRAEGPEFESRWERGVEIREFEWDCLDCYLRPW